MDPPCDSLDQAGLCEETNIMEEELTFELAAMEETNDFPKWPDASPAVPADPNQEVNPGPKKKKQKILQHCSQTVADRGKETKEPRC